MFLDQDSRSHVDDSVGRQVTQHQLICSLRVVIGERQQGRVPDRLQLTPDTPGTAGASGEV